MKRATTIAPPPPAQHGKKSLFFLEDVNIWNSFHGKLIQYFQVFPLISDRFVKPYYLDYGNINSIFFGYSGRVMWFKLIF